MENLETGELEAVTGGTSSADLNSQLMTLQTTLQTALNPNNNNNNSNMMMMMAVAMAMRPRF
ncbi:MAG TPA: hypothetical protein VFP84_31090 [Kofleriaceae bacterium]|nr:hypothetical protein [Kofleriaceae bacterium]